LRLKRLEHVGIVVSDLEDGIAFFTALGMEVSGRARVGGETVDRIVGLQGIDAEIAMLKAPGDRGGVELVRFDSPGYEGDEEILPSNVPGIRHLAFQVEGLRDMVSRLTDVGAELVGEIVQYEDSYLLCYLRGPGGAIIELAEPLN